MPWASAQLEDLTGGIEVMFFPHTYSTFGAEIADDTVVIVSGKVNSRDDRLSLIANDLVVPDFSSAQADRPVAVSLPTRQCTVEKVVALKQVLANHPPGTSQVRLRLISGDRITTLELDQALRVTPSSALMGDLKALLVPAASAANPARSPRGRSPVRWWSWRPAPAPSSCPWPSAPAASCRWGGRTPPRW